MPAILHSFQFSLLLFLKFACQMGEKYLPLLKTFCCLIRLIIFRCLVICISFSMDYVLASLANFFFFLFDFDSCSLCIPVINRLSIKYMLHKLNFKTIWKILLAVLFLGKLRFLKHYNDYEVKSCWGWLWRAFLFSFLYPYPRV